MQSIWNSFCIQHRKYPWVMAFSNTLFTKVPFFCLSWDHSTLSPATWSMTDVCVQSDDCIAYTIVAWTWSFEWLKSLVAVWVSPGWRWGSDWMNKMPTSSRLHRLSTTGRGVWCWRSRRLLSWVTDVRWRVRGKDGRVEGWRGGWCFY